MKVAYWLNNKKIIVFYFWNTLQKLEKTPHKLLSSCSLHLRRIFYPLKTKNSILIFSLLLLFIFISKVSVPQKYRYGNLRFQNEVWKIWSIGMDGGVLSFYGDLSIHDNDYIDKLKYESGPGLSVNLTKHFDRLFSLSGQLLAGKLKGSNYASSFNADLIEYNLNVRLNMYNLFYPYNKGKFGVTIMAGVGQFLYYSTKTSYNEGGNSVTSHDSRVPEFVYFIGGGGFIRPTERFGISMDMGLRQCQTDWLDVLLKNDDFDYYTYWNLGIVYYIDNFIHKKPVRNKARIAHSNAKLKHL